MISIKMYLMTLLGCVNEENIACVFFQFAAPNDHLMVRWGFLLLYFVEIMVINPDSGTERLTPKMG